MASFPSGNPFPTQFPKPNAFGAPNFPAAPNAPLGGLNLPPALPPMGSGFGAPPLGLPSGLPAGLGAGLPGLGQQPDSFGPQASALQQPPAFPQPQAPGGAPQQPDAFTQMNQQPPADPAAAQAGAAAPGGAPTGLEGFSDKNPGLPNGGSLSSKIYSPMGLGIGALAIASPFVLKRVVSGEWGWKFWQLGKDAAEGAAKKAIADIDKDAIPKITSAFGKLDAKLHSEIIDKLKVKEPSEAVIKDAKEKIAPLTEIKDSLENVKLEEEGQQDAYNNFVNAFETHITNAEAKTELTADAAKKAKDGFAAIRKAFNDKVIAKLPKEEAAEASQAGGEAGTEAAKSNRLPRGSNVWPWNWPGNFKDAVSTTESATAEAADAAQKKNPS